MGENAEELFENLGQIVFAIITVSIVIYSIWLTRLLLSNWEIVGSPIIDGFLAICVIIFPWIALMLLYYDSHVKSISKLISEFEYLSISRAFFFATITIVTFFSLILPLVTPLFAVIFFSIIIPYKIAERLKRNPSIFIGLAVLLFLLVFKVVLYVYIIATQWMLSFFWEFFQHAVEFSYKLALMMAAVSGLGDFLLLIYEGAKEYDPSVIVPRKQIYAIEVVLFMVFIYISLVYNTNIFVAYIALIGLSLVSNVIRWVKKVGNKNHLRDKVSIPSILLYSFIIAGESMKYIFRSLNKQAYFSYQLALYLIAALIVIGYYIVTLLSSKVSE
ncbi:MAG: hypothetical protein ACTSX9_04425 [Candidatus Njordarchaeales archaeon]